MFLQHWSTAKRIIGLVICMLIFTGMVGGTGYYYISHIKKSLEDMYRTNLLPVEWLNMARAESRTVESLTMELLLADMDKTEVQQKLNEAKSRSAEVERLIGQYANQVTSPQRQQQTAEIKSMLESYHSERSKALALAMTGQKQAAYAYFANRAAGHINHINSVMEQMAHSEAEQAAARSEHSELEAAMAVKVSLGITLLALLLSLGLGLVIARRIAQPIKFMVVRAVEMADGNLTGQEVAANTQDEVGQLARAFNTMAANLRQLVQQVSQSSQQVAGASEQLTDVAEQSAQAATQIAASIMEVAQGSERQFRTIKDTTGVVEQMVNHVRQVAGNTDTAAAIAEQSAATAREGGKTVAAAIRQMVEIEKAVTDSATVVTKLGARSQQIGQIVDTIAGIAGQTNLLALNAAIEAARAGEQGRGFAVVAEEVRKLAEESQAAAKQIAALIRDIQQDTQTAVVAMQAGTQEVTRGAAVVNTAGDAFSQIAALVDEVADHVRESSASIRRVADGSGQIVGAMQEMDEVSRSTAAETQTISAATEEQSASMQEMAASSQRLADMAQVLENAVRKFRV